MYTRIAEAASAVPTVNITSTIMNSGTYQIVFGAYPVTGNRTASSSVAVTTSTATSRIAAIGNASRGQYSLFSRGTFETRLSPPWETELAKKVHGRRPM